MLELRGWARGLRSCGRHTEIPFAILYLVWRMMTDGHTSYGQQRPGT